MKPSVASRRLTFGVTFAFALLLSLLAAAMGAGDVRAAAAPRPAPSPSPTPKDFDLVEQSFDPDAPKYDANRLLLNPQWGWQRNNPYDPRDPLKHFPNSLDTDRCPDKSFKNCTSTETDLDPAGFCTFLVCGFCSPSQLGFCPPPGTRVHGHVNWVPATYTGTSCWNNISFPDMDYTFSFIPEGRAGLTLYNHPNQHPSRRDRATDPEAAPPKQPLGFHIEFDSRATVAGFNTKTWTDLRKLVDPCKANPNCDKKTVQEAFDGKRAVVMGLVNLDSEHTGYSELHPVYVLAVEVDPNPADNTWLVFARNRGTQGFCSQNDHPLPPELTEVRLLIPRPPPDKFGNLNPVVSVEFADRTQFSTNLESSCPTPADFRHFKAVGLKQTEGVLVSFRLPQRFDLPEPFVGPIVEGEIHLKWVAQSADKPVAPYEPVPTDCKPFEKVKEAESLTEREPTPQERLAILEQIERALASQAPVAQTTWKTCAIPPGVVASDPGVTAAAEAAMTAGRPAVTRMKGKKAEGFNAFRKAVVDTICKGPNGKTYKCR